MRHDPWRGIGTTAEHIVGMRAQDEHPLDVYWIKEPDGAPGLMFRSVDADRFPEKTPSLKGLSLQTTVTNAVNELRMMLKDPEAREVFLTLCTDVISYSGTGSSPSDATTRVFRRLQHWQSLMAYVRSRAMESHEVRGLIGELYVLEQLSIALGFDVALRAWVAPDDQPQDFACEDRLIEVKTRASGSRQTVRISSLQQLEPAQLPLYLVAVEVVPSSGVDARTLNEYCSRLLEEVGAVSAKLMEKLEVALLRRGYVRMDEYDDDAYCIAGVSAYECRSGFPRITKSEVDARIVEAQYVLDLSLLGEYAVPAESVMA